MQGDEAVVAFVGHGGVEPTEQAGGVAVRAETNAVARLQPLAGFHEGGPDVGSVAMVQGRFDIDAEGFAGGAGALPHTGEPGGDDAGVVEHQGVAGAQEIGQVAYVVVGEAAGADDQQAGGVARLGGAEGDAVLGQVEVEIGGAHGVGVGAWGRGGVNPGGRLDAPGVTAWPIPSIVSR